MRSRWFGFGLSTLLVLGALGCGRHRAASHVVTHGGRAGSKAAADGGPKNQDAGDETPDASRDDSSTDARTADGSEFAALDFTQIGSPQALATTYSLAESPNWDHCTESLLFVDVDASVIHQLKDGEFSVFMQDSGCTNGMTFDANGDLLMAQMGCGPSGKVARRDRMGNISVLADHGPMNATLHTPDDIALRSDGNIYFTDGDFPHAAHALVLSSLFTPLPIYRIAPDGELFNIGTTTGPNGIELSPDEKTLYVSSYFGGQVLKYAIADDGTVQPDGTLVTAVTNPDSLCLDVQGNVYLGVAAGLLVMRPDGTKLGTIPMTTLKGGPTSCGFGGSDGKTLYVTDWTTLFKIDDMPIPGLEWTIHQKFPCP